MSNSVIKQHESILYSSSSLYVQSFLSIRESQRLFREFPNLRETFIDFGWNSLLLLFSHLIHRFPSLQQEFFAGTNKSRIRRDN